MLSLFFDHIHFVTIMFLKLALIATLASLKCVTSHSWVEQISVINSDEDFVQPADLPRDNDMLSSRDWQLDINWRRQFFALRQSSTTQKWLIFFRRTRDKREQYFLQIEFACRLSRLTIRQRAVLLCERLLKRTLRFDIKRMIISL